MQFLFHSKITARDFQKCIHNGTINFAGNVKLKIYGRLKCASGKRMKKESRVFFSSDKEAVRAGFRPCAHCLPQQYIQWKRNPDYLAEGI